jgi:transposase InsO family protein
MTDDGSGYRNGVRHVRTPPYTPHHGKAEAFIRILQREGAYGFAYHSSAHRARALPYICWYNKHRPHGSLGGHPPISRVS